VYASRSTLLASPSVSTRTATRGAATPRRCRFRFRLALNRCRTVISASDSTCGASVSRLLSR
jgi:hypothetical protein